MHFGPPAAFTLNQNHRVTTRWLGFVAWAVVAAGAGAWALGLFEPDSAPERSATADPAVLPGGDLPRMVRAELPPVAPVLAPATTADRFKLVGLVAPGLTAQRMSAPASEGIALISVDGKPARAFSVGATVDGDTVLQQVSSYGATLGPRGGGAAVSLQVEVPPSPAPVPTTGSVSESQRPISKHPPLPAPTWSAPQNSVGGTAVPGDGSWTR